MLATVALAVLAVLVTLSVANVLVSRSLSNETAQRKRADLAAANERTAKNRALEANVRTERARQSAESAFAVAQTNLTFSRMRLAHQYWRNGDVPEAALLLDRCPPDARQWEWHYLRRLCNADLLRIYSQIRSTDAQFSSDDRRLLVGIDGLLSLWDPQSWQKVREISLQPRVIGGVALSADGQRMAALVGEATVLPAGSPP